MGKQANYTTDPEDIKPLLDHANRDLDRGTLGRFFGSPQQSAASIAWVVIFLLTCSGIAVLFFKSFVPAIDYWTIITPIITLALGYLFGGK